MPSASATRRPSPTSAVASVRSAGTPHSSPCVSPVSAAIGLVAALNSSLVHCAPRASSSATAPVAPASAAISSGRAGCGSNGPIHVMPGASISTTPGAATWPAASVTPRITRGTWRAIASSLPIPFCTLHTAPSANTCAAAAIAGSVSVAFVATMPSSQGGISRASARAAMCTIWPSTRRPLRLIASTCSSETS